MQRIFTFHSSADIQETINIVTNAVYRLNGKVKVSGNMVIAKWWSKNTTLFPHKFKFYIGNDIVRVVTNDMNDAYYKKIKLEFSYLNPIMKLWDVFIEELISTFPNMDFELESGKMHLTSAKIVSDGIEQVFSSTSKTKPSIGGALVGGALFGGVGALIGASHTKTSTSGSSTSVFSDYFLATARYSNGLYIEGKISKKSSVYNYIVVSMSELNK